MKFPIQIAIVALLSLSSLLPAKDYTLFILAGQSNAQGYRGDGSKYPPDPKNDDPQIPFFWWPHGPGYKAEWMTLQKQEGIMANGYFGPEVSFARAVLENGGHPAVFKFCKGSTSIAGNWKGPGDHGMWDGMTNELKKAIDQMQKRGDKVTIGAFIWIQGESDAKTKEDALAYEERLKKLIDDMRTNIAKNPNLPVILGVDEQHSAVKVNPEVITAQENLAAKLPMCIRTSMLGLKKADGTHLTAEALPEHGLRLYEAYVKLTGKK